MCLCLCVCVCASLVSYPLTHYSPFVVVVGWITGHDFTLDFDPFATLALTVSVMHANFVTSDARSHWLMVRE